MKSRLIPGVVRAIVSSFAALVVLFTALISTSMPSAESSSDVRLPEELSGQWEASTSLPAPRYWFGAASDGSHVFVTGGKQANVDTDFRATVFSAPVDDAARIGSWITTTALPEGINSHATVIGRGYLFVIGGYHCCWGGVSAVRNAPINSDGTVGAWSPRTTLPRDLYRLAAIAYGEYIYVFGGWSDALGSVRAEVYSAHVNADGSLDSWTSLASLPQPRHGHAAAIVGDHVYVIGGLGADTVYSAQLLPNGGSSSWITQTSLPVALGYSAAIGSQGRLIVLGGSSGGGLFRQEGYVADVSTDGTLGSWQPLPLMPLSLGLNQAISTTNHIAIIGGFDGVAVHPESFRLSIGFRPNPDGYSFPNPGGTVPDCTDFQRSFSGLDIQCFNGQPQQKYRGLFDRYRHAFSTGICTGMASTSLAYYVEIESLLQPSSTFGLTYDQAWPNIATFHGRQNSQAVHETRVRDWQVWAEAPAIISQRVDNAYIQLKASLQPSNTNPLVLDLFPRPAPTCTQGSAHSVAPYRVDETDPLRPRVYVYENFAPGDSNHFVQFDFTSPAHRFTYWLWDSSACGSLVATPLSAFTGLTGTVPSSHIFASTGGNIEAVLVNNIGGVIGYLDGVLTSTISDAMPIYPWYSPGVTPTVTEYVVPYDNYTTTLIAHGEAFSYTLWSISGTIEFHGNVPAAQAHNAPQTITDSNQLVFSRDLQRAVLSAQTTISQPVQLKMSLPQTDTKIYTLNNFYLPSGGNLATEISDSGLWLHSENITTNYDLRADVVSTQTLAAFKYSGLSIVPGDIQTVTFSDWSTVYTATLQIDHGGDGAIDETRILLNQLGAPYKVYLPIALHVSY